MEKIKVVRIPGKGRGVVATAPIAKGETVERSPVLPIALKDSECPALADYSMAWGEAEDSCEPGTECCVGLGYLMIYNHASKPNITIRRHFDVNEMSMVALRDIAAGEELAYDYDVPLWFTDAAE
jgi:SET domain-containing protein